jgi:hypothetical protein
VWSWLLIGGPVITGLINAYKAKLDAANTQDRIAADLAAKEIEAEIAARKEASAIIIAEQGRWYTAIIRPLLAFPLVIYLWKVIVWDDGRHKSLMRQRRPKCLAEPRQRGRRARPAVPTRRCVGYGP